MKLHSLSGVIKERKRERERETKLLHFHWEKSLFLFGLNLLFKDVKGFVCHQRIVHLKKLSISYRVSLEMRK